MKIITKLPALLGFGAITIWPFIFVLPAQANDKALWQHELVHYREQRAAWVIPWLLRYLFDSDFRFAAEVRGHAVQIKHGGCSLAWAALQITDKYRTGKSFDQAFDALQKELST